MSHYSLLKCLVVICLLVSIPPSYSQTWRFCVVNDSQTNKLLYANVFSSKQVQGYVDKLSLEKFVSRPCRCINGCACFNPLNLSRCTMHYHYRTGRYIKFVDLHYFLTEIVTGNVSREGTGRFSEYNCTCLVPWVGTEEAGTTSLHTGH